MGEPFQQPDKQAPLDCGDIVNDRCQPRFRRRL